MTILFPHWFQQLQMLLQSQHGSILSFVRMILSLTWDVLPHADFAKILQL